MPSSEEAARNLLQELADKEDLIPASAAAKTLGVTPAAVSNWSKRHSDFPQPRLKLWRYKFYDRQEIIAWHEKHKDDTHGGRRMPELAKVYRMARRLSAEDQLKLKGML